jgi:hypothetical protein
VHGWCSLRRLNDRARNRFDPQQLIHHALDACCVLRQYAQCGAFGIMPDASHELHYTIAHGDANARARRSGELNDVREDAAPDLLVIITWTDCFRQFVYQCAQKIRATYNANQLAVTWYQPALYSVRLHHRYDLIEGIVRGNRERLPRHDFPHLLSIPMHIVDRLALLVAEQRTPMREVTLGAEIRTPKQIGFSHNPHQLTEGAEHRQSAHAVVEQ